jgi:preprotein translocase subunit SecA
MSDTVARKVKQATAPIPARPHHKPVVKAPAIDNPLVKLQSYASVLVAPLRSRHAWAMAQNAIALESEMTGATDEVLRARANTLRNALRRGGLRDAIVVEAMALTREISRRHIGMAPYAQQLMAGYALLKGAVVEMDTGEGKTLTSIVPSAIHALSGRLVHVVAPNDYLAQRDGTLLRPALEALGVSVGIVVHEMSPADRRAAYGCNVTFVSNKEVAFDYLRDRLLAEETIGDHNIHLKVRKALAGASAKAEPMLRGLDVAIVDEIDSVLIDDAGTPLLISAQSDASLDEDAIRKAVEIASVLDERTDFIIGAQSISVGLTKAGEARIDALATGLPGIWRQRIRRHEIVRAAVTAHRVLARDKHYLVRDGKVVIIDQNTGRTMPDRYWGHDLHIIAEVKEGCAPSGLRKSLASISFQRFFRGYRTLAGMSGTVREVAVELRKVYDLPLIRVPRRRPLRRRFLGRALFADRDALWREAAQRIAETSRRGQPVLVGVRTVAEAERGSEELHKLGIPHTVLSAAHDQQEAEIVARAGHRGTVTIATNMAGRGTDIKLAEGVEQTGGLMVMICERHDFQRVDRQLMGRCGRQGDPGDVVEFLSYEDGILTLASPWLRLFFNNKRLAQRAVALAFLQAQWRAERAQTRARLELVRNDARLHKMLAFAGGLD